MRLRIILTLALLGLFSLVSAQQLDVSKITNLNIRNVGPANMSGRITTIAVEEKNPKVMYVGAASGGVWKSTNGGSAWAPIFDDQPTQNIGALAIDQKNPSIIWAGTGEGNPRNSMNLGMGIFKSLDGGSTWQHMGLKDTKTIHRIIVDPRDGNIVYVGAMGDPFTPNSHRGLYKTTDGGKTWEKILYSNDKSGIADLVMDPKNPNKLIAALYEHRRTPYYFTSGGSGSGLFVSYNGGEDWKQLTEDTGLPAGDLGRIGIAIAQSDPDRIYAKVEAKRNALYRSDDGGSSWQMINNNPRFTNNRPFYFQELAVDTKDPNRLYNIYQPLSVSYDGGKSFDPVPMIPADETKGIHADFHAFWVNPKDPEHFIIGGDGGIGITYDHGKSWYFPETIPVAQFYHINVDNDRPYNVYGGMQDNGNWSGPGYTWKRGGIRTLYWQYLVGGDGFYIAPDLDDSRFGYGTSQNGNLYRYDKLTGYYVSIKPPQEDLSTRLRFNWNAGFAKDPHNPSALYYGSQFLHVTKDKGATWDVISPDLTTNNPAHQKPDYGGLTLDVSGAEMYNSILAISPSPINESVIWVGTDDGQVQLTTNKGRAWKNLTKNVKGLPKEAWIAQIKASAYKEGTAWLVANNYRKGDYDTYLFKTDDFGKSWMRKANNEIVQGYALSIVQDPVEPNLIFLGTENGLWVSIDEGDSWVQFKNGFPSVSTMDMTIQKPESALIVGTFGRAIWVLDDLLSLREIAGKRLKNGITALPMNDAVQVKGLFINPPGNIWTGFHTTFEGENKVFQRTEIPFYLSESAPLSESVEANIYDASGKRIKTLRSTEKLVEGLNYMIWQLDEESALGQSRRKGIPVLPGEYRVVLTHNGSSDEASIRLIEDPRFALNPAVDIELYGFRKEVDVELARISKLFELIDERLTTVQKVKEYLSEEKGEDVENILKQADEIDQELLALRSKGQTTRPDRQVGAWQSFEVTPYSKLMEVRRLVAARTTAISAQNREQLKIAKGLIDEFEKAIDQQTNSTWSEFQALIKKLKVNWF
ncbi:WD40/YVTN/BNR-like repeat-containing protein [Roseivirga misakiensis]|uniref:Glycosyl hydrolase n=1 Tax=Roseivirga misakiensis TaxID=1563681 RepID=A0A1E5T071_9BACT|nr:glycosyl hydrolase [Roseivirga misakiensis]OEK04756.1 glycosyl hydrolase [Roseivirga misakiensis]